MPSDIELMNENLSRDRSPDGRSPDSKGGSLGRGGRGPYKQDTTGLQRIPTPKYSKEIVERALELMAEHSSVHAAQQALAEELGKEGLTGPSYNAMWSWAKGKDTLLERLTANRKDQLVAVASDVALKAAQRMLEALPKLSDSQIPVAYGIAMQRRADWENTGNKANQLNVQFNLVTRE